MTKLVVLVIALAIAVHVSVGNVPAPVPVLLVFALVIGALCWLIWEAAFRTVPAAYRRAGP